LAGCLPAEGRDGDAALLGFGLVPDEAVRQVVVHETAGLHTGVDRDRPDEGEAALAQPPRPA